jgi:hypothetical protein
MPLLGTRVYSVAGAIDANLDSTTEIDVGTFGAASRSMRRKSSPRRVTEAATGPQSVRGSICHGKVKGLRLAK